MHQNQAELTRDRVAPPALVGKTTLTSPGQQYAPTTSTQGNVLWCITISGFFILLGTLASIVMIVFAGKEQSRPYHPCKNGRSKAHKINVVFVVLHSGMSMADNLHRTAVCTE